jgi:hypothetical protein
MPVTVFQRMDQFPCRVIKGNCGSGSVPGRRIGFGSSTDGAITQVIGKGDAKLIAARLFNENQLPPTAAAQRAWLENPFAADQALGRDNEVGKTS